MIFNIGSIEMKTNQCFNGYLKKSKERKKRKPKKKESYWMILWIMIASAIIFWMMVNIYEFSNKEIFALKILNHNIFF